MTNPPSITSRKVDDEEIIVFTWPNKLIFLHTIIITENVNIGMIQKSNACSEIWTWGLCESEKMAKLYHVIESIWRLKRLNQSKKKLVPWRPVFKMLILNSSSHWLSDSKSFLIGSWKSFKKVGWEFGSSKFISDTETITYFKKGHGALLLTTRQLIKGVEQWKNLKLIKFSERPLSSLGIDLRYCSRAPPSAVQILCACSLAPWLLSCAVTAF